MISDFVQSSSGQVPLTVPDDNGSYLDIKSSANDDEHVQAEEKKIFTEPESRTSKEDARIALTCKEREKLLPCFPSIKSAVHFDKPNRLVM